MAKYWKWLVPLLIAAWLIGGCAGAGGGEASDPNGGDGDRGAAPIGEIGEHPADASDSNEDGHLNGREVEKHTVTLYFSDDQLTQVYKVQAEIEGNNNDEIVQAALDRWVEGPDDPALSNLLPAETTARFDGEEDGVAYVNFSADVRSANLGSGGEAALVEQIVMLMEQFGYAETQILVEGEVVETLLGHMQVNVPIAAKAPDQFEWYRGNGEE